MSKGWAKFHGRKFHYYGENGRALCGRSICFTKDPAAFEDDRHDHPENCAECKRRKAKEAQK